jgi:hypothetical protein
MAINQLQVVQNNLQGYVYCSFSRPNLASKNTNISGRTMHHRQQESLQTLKASAHDNGVSSSKIASTIDVVHERSEKLAITSMETNEILSTGFQSLRQELQELGLSMQSISSEVLAQASWCPKEIAGATVRALNDYDDENECQSMQGFKLSQRRLLLRATEHPETGSCTGLKTQRSTRLYPVAKENDIEIEEDEQKAVVKYFRCKLPSYQRGLVVQYSQLNHFSLGCQI